MRIALFGGRFDPIHIGHLILAYDLIEKFNIFEFLFVVSHRPPHKGVRADFKDRLQMVKLAIKGEKRFRASDVEMRIPGEKNYTVNLLKTFKSYGEVIFFMGYDQYLNLHTWFKPEEVLKLAKVVVLKRPEVKKRKTPFDHKVQFLETRLLDISSSEIRRRIQENRPYRQFLPEEVYRYILIKGLYR